MQSVTKGQYRLVGAICERLKLAPTRTLSRFPLWGVRSMARCNTVVLTELECSDGEKSANGGRFLLAYQDNPFALSIDLQSVVRQQVHSDHHHRRVAKSQRCEQVRLEHWYAEIRDPLFAKLHLSELEHL